MEDFKVRSFINRALDNDERLILTVNHELFIRVDRIKGAYFIEACNGNNCLLEGVCVTDIDLKS